MEIKVLGPGCPKCKKLLKIVEELVQELKVDASVVYVTDSIEIANTGLIGTPGLMINNRIVLSGRIPTKAELTGRIKAKI
jgi:small redox-active disulfide protein 2